jgi:deoxyribonuclease V
MSPPGWRWPDSREALAAEQDALARARPPPWRPPAGPIRVAGCAAVSRRGGSGPGAAGEPGWAAAVLVEVGAAALRELDAAGVSGSLPAAFEAGSLALREGPLLAAAIAALGEAPEVLLVHGAGRDHPRRAGLALMLGAATGLPSVGVTDRPLVARGALPGPGPGAESPLVLGGDEVARWLRTRAGAGPVAVHAAWRTTPEVASAVVLAACAGARLPAPLQRALVRARRLRDLGA